MKAVVLALMLTACADLAAAQPSPPAPAVAKGRLTADSKLGDLASDPRTAAVLERHMPGFIDRMKQDEDHWAMFAGITFRELEQDPHVRGLTPEVTAKIDAELAAAQASVPRVISHP
jgi:hypothetical protein